MIGFNLSCVPFKFESGLISDVFCYKVMISLFSIVVRYRSNPINADVLYLSDTNRLASSHFNKSNALIIYLHGFSERVPGGAGQSSQEIRDGNDKNNHSQYIINELPFLPRCRVIVKQKIKTQWIAIIYAMNVKYNNNKQKLFLFFTLRYCHLTYCSNIAIDCHCIRVMIAFLKANDYNILLVDWSPVTALPW